jgi:hypothetical protein
VPPCDLKEEYQNFGAFMPPSAGYKMEAAHFPLFEQNEPHHTPGDRISLKNKHNSPISLYIAIHI